MGDGNIRFELVWLRREWKSGFKFLDESFNFDAINFKAVL